MQSVKIKRTSLGLVCNQKIEDLTDKNNQKYCTHCSQTVIDFTTWTSEDIKAYLSKSPKTCGYYDIEQIATPITINTLPLKKRILMFYLGLIGSLNMSKLNASPIAKELKTEQLQKSYSNSLVINNTMDIDTSKTRSSKIKEERKSHSKKHINGRRKGIYFSKRFPFIFTRRFVMGAF